MSGLLPTAATPNPYERCQGSVGVFATPASTPLSLSESAALTWRAGIESRCFCACPKSKPRYSPAMQAHRAETTLSEDGVITLRDIPFLRGESVEVIVLPFSAAAASGSRYPLRGTPVTLLSPTEPVADADWEAAG